MDIFIRFLPYAGRQKSLYILGFIGSIFRFLIPLAVPMAMKYLFDELLQNATLTYVDKLQQLLFIAAVMLAVFFLIRGPMEYVRQFFLHKANNNVIRELRTEAFGKVFALDAKYYSENRSGEIGTRFFDDIEKIRNYMTALFSNIWIEITVLFFCRRCHAFLKRKAYCLGRPSCQHSIHPLLCIIPKAEEDDAKYDELSVRS
jgi:ATP-binding cassette, subfamily B, putative efflux pump